MKKIVFLGCENSHANKFLDFIKEGGYPEIEIAGVYSDDTAAAEKLRDAYGVPVLESFDALAGQADGVIITARHGDAHYKFARPYIKKGVTMFIDKPITVSESDVIDMMRDFAENDVRFTGGSCCRYAESVQKLRQYHLEGNGGKTVGGFVRAPIVMQSPYGGLYFYAQHLVEIVTEIFGYTIRSVKAFENAGDLTVVFRYQEYDVTGLFVNNSYKCYSAARFAFDRSDYFDVSAGKECFRIEFDEFYRLLTGGEQKATEESFTAPVFILNAIERSLGSGAEETVRDR